MCPKQLISSVLKRAAQEVQMTEETQPVTRRALLSVTDKSGIAELAKGLIDLGFEIWSTGGTAQVLREAGLGVEIHDVAALAGKPLFGDLVKTLSREVAAGLLCDPNDPAHKEELRESGLEPFELVCVNFYALERAITAPNATDESIRRATDVGGPTMAHEGAKGRKGGYRVVVTSPADYGEVLSWLRLGKPDAEKFVRDYAGKAEFAVAKYLGTSANHLGGYLALFGRPIADVVGYAENRWQRLVGTGYFATDDADPLAIHRFERLDGDSSGAVGITDFSRGLETAVRIAAGFEVNFQRVPLIAVAVKHGNPCGAAAGDNAHDVMQDVVRGDPLAIFGGFVVTNFVLDEAEAHVLLHHGTEGRRPIDGIAAPGFTDKAVELLSRKNGRCRLYCNPALASIGLAAVNHAPRFIQVRGGFIAQSAYDQIINLSDPAFEWRQEGPELSAEQQRDAVLAWAVAMGSNSNTVVLAKLGMVIGVGAGQQDRKACCELAVHRAHRAQNSTSGSVAWSDSFFPFADALEVLIRTGADVVFASRGSIRDSEVVECAKRVGGGTFVFLTAPDAKIRGFTNHTG